MNSIIILYDLIAREYWACNELKKEFETKRIKTYLFQWNFEFYKALRIACKEKIDLIVIPSCYTAEDYERIVMPFKKINNRIKVICMHHEQIGYIDEIGGLVPTHALTKNTMYHLSWAGHFTNLLKEQGVDTKFILEAGNLRLQEHLLNKAYKSREELSEEFNLDLKKKWVLYCDSGGSLFHEMDAKGLLASELIGASEIGNKMVPYYSQTHIKTTEIFNNLSNEFYEKYELVYRLHPGVKDTDKRTLNNKIHIIRDYSVYTWLNHVHFNITAYSTTIFESDALGVKSIILNPIELKHKIYGVSEYTTIKTREELEAVLLNENIPIKKNLYLHYIGKVSRDVMIQFVEIVENLIYQDNDTSQIECKINNRKRYSSLIANIVFFVFYKLKILQFVKWPFAFNMNKYEHPIYKNKYIDNS